METKVTIDIKARPETVWQVLADVERWPQWTASMTSVELDSDSLQLGATALIQQPKLPIAERTVTAFQPGESFTWESHAAGIDSIGIHDLIDLGVHGTAVTLTVRQTGPVAFLMKPWISRLTRRYMAMEAEGLRHRCEADVNAGPMLAASY